MKQSSLFVVFMAVLCGAATASAQVRRPYRGLFGGESAAQGSATLLEFDLSLGGGYDDSVFGETAGTIDDSTWDGGLFGRVAATLTFTKETDRASVGATVGTDARYFPRAEPDFFGAYTASLGGRLPLGRESYLTASQRVSYQPFLALDLFPSVSVPAIGISEPAALERGTPFDDSMLYLTALEFTQPTSRRGAVSFTYGFELNDFTRQRNDFKRHNASGRYTHGISRGLAVRAGYGYSVGTYPGEFDQDMSGHVIDVGIDYNNAISFSRRTTMSFSTGSSAVTSLDETSYGIIGNVTLSHEIGRTWNASAAYSRNVSFVRTFDEPFLADSLTAAINGLITRRLEFELTGAASLGDVGLSGESNGFTSYAGLTRFVYGLTRHLALAATYAIYTYSFDSGVTLPIGLSPETERQSALLALQLWFPLYQR